MEALTRLLGTAVVQTSETEQRSLLCLTQLAVASSACEGEERFWIQKVCSTMCSIKPESDVKD